MKRPRIRFGSRGQKNRGRCCLKGKDDVLLPTRPKSIMLVSCLEDSIHSAGLARSRHNDKDSNNNNKNNIHSNCLVQFGVIQIREYERIPGDNPCVRRGVPLGIGWQYNQQEGCSVDAYEMQRPQFRTKSDFLMSAAERYELLLTDWEHSPREMATAVRNARRSKDQRRTTIVVGEFEDRINLHRVKEVLLGCIMLRNKKEDEDDYSSAEWSKDHMSLMSKRASRSSKSSNSSELDMTRHRGKVSIKLLPEIMQLSEEEYSSSADGFSTKRINGNDYIEEGEKNVILADDDTIQDTTTSVCTNFTHPGLQFSEELSAS
mmetsp:Transcript_12038/g.17646  ORF Transcript_12038/g.17646 Transcript_12038/m.17646 type:complete len:318 (-) Transcript_12038:18-971(-)|eukprot:CAMPEP_0194206430 /NCGR_PEP_ID=MMETSP0156-20130528/5470_1 /TAXON_ID=33649 /ORGANISM="Thalassionema nitzschioides, Strain L26-B" /LENGTH=317 /DNA_ID=CAMNT_0038932957 /DNA_START=113 /DNA_END=1066 /DNA_ORIENTATION=-